MKNRNIVIFENSPEITDWNTLTTLCLLQDQILLFSECDTEEKIAKYTQLASLHPEYSQYYLEKVAFHKNTLPLLKSEGILEYLNPAEIENKFPLIDNIELDISLKQPVDEKGLTLLLDNKKVNRFTRSLVNFLSLEKKPVISDFIRIINMLGVAHKYSIPLITYKNFNRLDNSISKPGVKYFTDYLSHKSLNRLTFPALETYSAEDILLVRKNLEYELEEYRSAMQDLVWVIHNKIDLNDDIEKVTRECDILINTKISSSLKSLEAKIKKHSNSRIRNVLKKSGNIILEIGKGALATKMSGQLMGASSSLLKATDLLDSNEPFSNISTFIFKVKNKINK